MGKRDPVAYFFYGSIVLAVLILIISIVI